jgi:hypothetical protein
LLQRLDLKQVYKAYFVSKFVKVVKKLRDLIKKSSLAGKFRASNVNERHRIVLHPTNDLVQFHHTPEIFGIVDLYSIQKAMLWRNI